MRASTGEARAQGTFLCSRCNLGTFTRSLQEEDGKGTYVEGLFVGETQGREPYRETMCSSPWRINASTGETRPASGAFFCGRPRQHFFVEIQQDVKSQAHCSRARYKRRGEGTPCGAPFGKGDAGRSASQGKDLH
jgi:hypothetical protein